MRVSSPKREARHEQLLTAALRVFSRNGFDGASVADIAEEAGVAKGSIYLYFSSKEALAGDLVRHVFSQTNSDGRPGKLDRPLQRILKFCEEQEQRVLSLGEFSSIVLHMWGQAAKAGHSHISRGVRQIINESAFFLATLLESARSAGELPKSVNTEAAAMALLAICYGLIHYRITLPTEKAQTMGKCSDTLKVYLRGLGAKI